MNIPFGKYHGCGNDFIITSAKAIPDGIDLQDLIVKACDRHTGIGADGFIIVAEDPLEMVYYNQDGSRAPMCGNGIRCFARYCQEEGIVQDDVFDVQTLAGKKRVEVVGRDPWTFRINMGKPDFDPASISVSAQKPVWDYPLVLDNGEVHICSFFMSTVHTVLFCRDAFSSIEKAGAAICHHPFFQEQTNVNFVQVVDENHLKVQTYERGCGVTLACGTGVCASVVAALKKGFCTQSVEVEMKKGSLHIDIADDLTVYMSGPAALICKGEFNYD